MQTPTTIQMKIPTALPEIAMLDASAPKIAGMSDEKIESPTDASGPIRLVLMEETVSILAAPSRSSMARSIPITNVFKLLDVLKNPRQCMSAASCSASESSP